MLNLDTHIIVYMVQDQLPEKEKKQILTVNDQLCISSIVLWELAMLIKKNRILFDFGWPEWKELLADLKLIEIDEKIAIQAADLDFHSDPADKLIAATSIVHNIPLLTRDTVILASKIVPFAK